MDGQLSPIIMVSHGKHTHPPIPPTKTPVAVGNQLIKLINQSQKGLRYLGKQPTVHCKSMANFKSTTSCFSWPPSILSDVQSPAD